MRELPPVSAPGQPYPYPFRERGAMQAPEERFELDGVTTRVFMWTYGGGWNRRDARVRVKKHRTEAEAREAIDAMVAARIGAGWAPLPDWPETPSPWVRVAANVPAQPSKPPRAPRAPTALRMSTLEVVARKAPVKARDVSALEHALGTELPPSWVELLRSVGPGVFCKRLAVRSPEEALRATKRRRKAWTDEELRKAFEGFDDVVGARASELVSIACSIDGDDVVFVSGRPSELFVLPRSSVTVVRAKSFPVVLAYFYRVARDVDGVESPTYAPGANL